MILITGATGNIGTELVKNLVSKRVPIRVISRDEKKIAHLGPEVERVIGDRHELSVVQRALQGTDKVFVIAALFDKDHEADRLLVNEAQNAGVRQIVLISSGTVYLGEKNGIGVLHREKELLIEKSGIPWTFLRAGGFMSNAFQWLDTIKSQGKVFNPCGDGKSAPISPSDIAAVAALALTSSGHEGKAHDLIGSEVLSTHDQVRILSKVIGSPIECIDVPAEVVAERMRAIGIPEILIQGLIDVWTRTRNGESNFCTNEVENLTGKPAQTFETWCYEHRSAFV
ncbi:MAG: NAD(P)H-binding protein [Verrucomicrobia bacterium]|nr:NAD(P)H-binding protein [Verrucomicrobiota bacterium]